MHQHFQKNIETKITVNISGSIQKEYIYCIETHNVNVDFETLKLEL